MTLLRALDRTLLLMRDEVGDRVSNDTLLAVLTKPQVALVADAKNLESHSAQSAYITAALLMARSAHKVFLDAPNLQMHGVQLPLAKGDLIEQLDLVGRDMLPDVEFAVGRPATEVDLFIALGDSEVRTRARRCIRISADSWRGQLLHHTDQCRWPSVDWPLGGMAAGALAAGEAFKISMNNLLAFALNRENTAARFLPVDMATFSLASPITPLENDLGKIDFVSAGAISHSALFALSRIPHVLGAGIVVEPETYDVSNLNRYMLLLRSRATTAKAVDVSQVLRGVLALEPMQARYDAVFAKSHQFASKVLVGVDDIPTRWEVQRMQPDWLVIGATSHWSAMASFHRSALGCAQCLHYRDDPTEAPIPTHPCVSFCAGLLAATYLVRQRTISIAEQQVYVSPFRPDQRPWRVPVPARPRCPTCGGRGVAAAE